MAVNLIRAHREELLQASSGKLDHMVIDVVGSLFDQILSDPRCRRRWRARSPACSCRCCASRSSDPTFFSSRRHPVRRFVNRIASLACAFDDFDDGPGKQFLDAGARAGAGDRRRRLRPDRALRGQARRARDVHRRADRRRGRSADGAADDARGARNPSCGCSSATCCSCSTALQRRCRCPTYLRDFLSQVWSQALVLAVAPRRRDSPNARSATGASAATW